MNIPNRTQESIAADWMDAKNDEIAANKRRIEIEDELIKNLGSKLEGSETHQIGSFKVTITGRLNRKVDFDKADKLGISENLLPIRRKPELDLRGLRYLEENEPAIFKLFSKVLTVEPAKTSVTVIRNQN